MNDRTDTKDRRDTLRLFCCYNVLTLPRKRYSVIWKWTWLSFKFILQSLGQPVEKIKQKEYDWYAKRGKK